MYFAGILQWFVLLQIVASQCEITHANLSGGVKTLHVNGTWGLCHTSSATVFCRPGHQAVAGQFASYGFVLVMGCCNAFMHLMRTHDLRREMFSAKADHFRFCGALCLTRLNLKGMTWRSRIRMESGVGHGTRSAKDSCTILGVGQLYAMLSVHTQALISICRILTAIVLPTDTPCLLPHPCFHPDPGDTFAVLAHASATPVPLPQSKKKTHPNRTNKLQPSSHPYDYETRHITSQRHQ